MVETSLATAPEKPAAVAISATPAPAKPAAETKPIEAIEEGGDAEFDKSLDLARGRTAPKEQSKEEVSKVAGKESEKPKATEATKEEIQPGDEKLPKNFRERLYTVQTELKQARESITAKEKQITDAEARGKETSALTEQLKKLESEKADLTAQLGATRFEPSTEYKTTFERAFNEAAETAQHEINKLQILDADGNPVRPANWDKDFAKNIFRLDRFEARKESERLFGPDADLVLEHYTILHRENTRAQHRLEQEQKDWETNKKTREETALTQEATRREQITKLWADTNKELDADERFTVAPEDTELNKVRAEGYAYVDGALNQNGKTVTIQEKIKKDAEIRHRAANYTVEVQRRKAVEARLAELEEKLAEITDSKPGRVRKESGGDDTTEKHGMGAAMEELRKELA